MMTSPVPRLQADRIAADAHVDRLRDLLLDAEKIAAECAAAVDAAVIAETVALLNEKAADRRRDAEADRADAVAELREAIR